MLSDETNITGGNNMSHINDTTKSRKGKHLNYEDRLKIEALSKAGIKPKEIGQLLGGTQRKDNIPRTETRNSRTAEQ